MQQTLILNYKDMSRVNKILLVISIVLFSNSIYAQKNTWNLGFRIGYKSQILEKTKPSSLNIISTHRDIASPTIGLNLTYNITDRFSFTSGIAYLEYYANWFMGGKEWVNSKWGSVTLKYAQIPLNIKYAFPLWKSNFSVYGKFGFNIDYLADKVAVFGYQDTGIILHRHEWDYLLEYKHNATIYDKKINVLLNTGIGVAYRFKNGLGLSFEGEYYTGLRTMGDVLIEVKKRTLFNPVVLEEYRDLLLIKGDYWNFSIGISYTFKKKTKNKNNETLPQHREIQVE